MATQYDRSYIDDASVYDDDKKNVTPSNETAVSKVTDATPVKTTPAPLTFTEEQLMAIDKGAKPEVVEDDGASGVVVNPATESYAADWGSGITLSEAAKNSDKTGLELIRDRERWAKDTKGAPLDIFEIYELSKGRDLSMSDADFQKQEKKRASQEKWERTANFLGHLGSFIGTLAGGPAQPVESATELTKRQQMLRDKTLEQRRQANKDLLEAYRAEKTNNLAERRLDMQDAESKSRIAKNEAYMKYQDAKISGDKVMAAYHKAKLDALEAGLSLDQAIKQAKLAEIEARTKKIASGFAGKAKGGGKGKSPVVTKNTSIIEKRDKDGNLQGTIKKTSETTKGPVSTSKSSSTSKKSIKGFGGKK